MLIEGNKKERKKKYIEKRKKKTRTKFGVEMKAFSDLSKIILKYYF